MEVRSAFWGRNSIAAAHTSSPNLRCRNNNNSFSTVAGIHLAVSIVIAVTVACWTASDDQFEHGPQWFLQSLPAGGDMCVPPTEA